MQESVDAMRVALRVLAAITGRTPPDPKDVELLRRHAPTNEYESVDDMACAVVEEALKRFRAKREQAHSADQ